MRIAPFDALRPPRDRAKAVAAPPYDVMNAAEARAMAAGNPDSFLHVSRAEIDLPEGMEPYSDAVYAKAAGNFADLQRRGGLTRHGRRSFFVYRQRLAGHTQAGLVCCCHVEDYDRDLIKKHEKTRPDKEDDRTRHTLAIRAHSGPVFLTYKDVPVLEELFDEAVEGPPLYDFTAGDGIAHAVWEVAEPEAFVRAFEPLPVVYVADGHHRSASASRAAATCREQNPGHTGREEYNWFMTVLFPASRLRILAYNRTVADLNGYSARDFLKAVRERFEVSAVAAPVPPGPGRFSMYLDGGWYDLKAAPGSLDALDPIADLDVSILQERLLAPVLGIADQRSSKRIDFVGGIRGTAELEKRVDSRAAAVAFSLWPTTVAQLLAVADAGLIMPPKSTWFEPKLRDGLLTHTF